jgi:twinkle protein
MLNDHHAKLLEERGLDAELCEKFQIASDSKLGSDFISIPYFDGEIQVNAKRRTIAGEKRFYQDAGARQVFWNLNVIGDPTLASQPLVVTEGELDALAAIQAGFGRVVSVPNGAPVAEAGSDPSERYRFLDNAPKGLAECREIILAVDNDGPGVNLLNDLALRLGRARCKWVRYPRECKDLGDALRLYGPRGVVESINRAQWMEVDGLYRMSELPPLPPSPPHTSGFPGLDAHFRLRLGDLTVVTGVPSHGKTVFVNDIACRMAMRHKWPAAFASFEQVPQRDHRRYLRSWYWSCREIDQDANQQAEADSWIDKNFLFVVPNESDDASLDWVVERLSTAVIRHGVCLAIIDPWNEIEHDRPPDVSLTEYVGLSLRRLKKFARLYRVHLFVVAHPMKMRRGDNGKYPMPSLYEISDSAHWYNRCDVGVVVYREEQETTIRVAKSRYHDEIGSPGDVKVRYFSDRAQFELLG